MVQPPHCLPFPPFPFPALRRPPAPFIPLSLPCLPGHSLSCSPPTHSLASRSPHGPLVLSFLPPPALSRTRRCPTVRVRARPRSVGVGSWAVGCIHSMPRTALSCR